MQVGSLVKHKLTNRLMTIRKIHGSVATCDHVDKVDPMTLEWHLRCSANVSICHIENLEITTPSH